MALREELILDLSKARAAAEAFDREITQPVVVPVDLDVSKLTAARTELDKLDASVETTVDLDTTAARTDLDRLADTASSALSDIDTPLPRLTAGMEDVEQSARQTAEALDDAESTSFRHLEGSLRGVRADAAGAGTAIAASGAALSSSLAGSQQAAQGVNTAITGAAAGTTAAAVAMGKVATTSTVAASAAAATALAGGSMASEFVDAAVASDNIADAWDPLTGSILASRKAIAEFAGDTKQVAASAVRLDDIFSALGHEGMGPLTEEIEQAVALSKRLRETVQELPEGFGAAARGAEVVNDAMDDLRAQINQQVIAIRNQLAEAFDIGGFPAGALSGPAKEAADAFFKLVALANQLNNSVQETGEDLKALKDPVQKLTLKELADQLERVETGVEHVEDSLDDTTGSAARAASELRETEEAARGTAVQTAKVEEGLEDSETAARRLDDEMDEVAAATDKAAREAANLDRQVSQAGRSAGGLKKLIPGGLLAGVFAGFSVSQVVDGYRNIISASGDLEQSTALVSNVFGELSDTALTMTTEVAGSLLLSDKAAQQALGSFGNLFIAMGLGEQEALDLSSDILQLAADLASFNNITVDESLTALRAGLVGEAEPLRRLGVALSQARVESELASQGISKVGDEFSAQQLILGRAAIIFEDTALAQGDVARSSGQAVVEQAKLTAEWENTKAAIGEDLLPSYADLIGVLNDEVVPAFQEAGPAIASSVENMVTQVSAALVVLPDVLRETRQAFLDIGSFLEQPFAIVGLKTSVGEMRRIVSDMIQQIQQGTPEVEAFGIALSDAIRLQRLPVDDTLRLIDNLIATAALDPNQVARQARQIRQGIEQEMRTLEVGGVSFFEQDDIDRLERALFLLDQITTAAQPTTARGIVDFGAMEGQARANLALLDQVAGQGATAVGRIRGIIEQPIASPIQDLAPQMAQDMEDVRSVLGPAVDGVIDAFDPLQVGVSKRLTRVVKDAQRWKWEVRGAVIGAIDPIEGAAEQLVAGLDEQGNEIKLSGEAFVGNIIDSITQSEAFETGLRELEAMGVELGGAPFDSLAQRLREQGPAALSVLQDLLEDPQLAADAEAAMDDAGKGLFDAGLEPGIAEAAEALIREDPLGSTMLDLIDLVNNPSIRAALAAIVSDLVEGGIADGVASAAGSAPGRNRGTMTPPAPPSGGGDGGGGGGAAPPGTNRPGAEFNLTINNPVAQSVEDETGRFIQTVGGVVALLN